MSRYLCRQWPINVYASRGGEYYVFLPYDLPGLVNKSPRDRRVIEMQNIDYFIDLGEPLDIASDGAEHLLFEAFATQHQRQQCTIMKHLTLVEDFCQAAI